MDLFLDNYYLKECLNKANYSNLLLTITPPSTHEGYTLTGGTVTNKVKSDNVLIVFGTINDTHLIKDSSKEYCQEFQIAANAKKFIL
jgi:hypothetical protein